MNIQEIFPTKNEQRVAQRVIEALKGCSDINTIDITKKIYAHKSSSARASENAAIYEVLKSLQCLDVVTCRINPFEDSYFEKDHFTLNQNATEALNELYKLHKAKPYNPVVKEFRYIVFVCGFCGSAVGVRSSQKSGTCTTCGHKNDLTNQSVRILLKTNDMYDMQSAIKSAKIRNRGGTDELPNGNPEFAHKSGGSSSVL